MDNTQSSKSNCRDECEKLGIHIQSISDEKHQTAVTKLGFRCGSRDRIDYTSFYRRSHNAKQNVTTRKRQSISSSERLNQTLNFDLKAIGRMAICIVERKRVLFSSL